MKSLKRDILTTSALFALVALANAQTFQYGGNYVTTNTGLNGGSLPGNTGSADLDGIGSNDSISVVAFGTEYSSGLTEYLGTANGTVAGPRFYGGAQAIRYDANTLNAGFNGLSRVQSSDQIRVNYNLNSSNGDYQYADATYFKQADWSSLTTGQVGFGTTEVAFSLTTAGFATATAGQIRWLVEDNGNFYVSDQTYTPAASSTFSITGSAAAAGNWALYTPTATDMRIPTVGYTVLGSTFENITAVGWVLDVPRYSNGGVGLPVGITVNSFSSDLVTVPEPAAYSLLSGIIALGWIMSRRRHKSQA